MRAIAWVVSVIAALVVVTVAFLYAAGHYGMSDARYRCEGRLLPAAGSTTVTVTLRVQLYRWWMHWLRRGGVVLFEYPSFVEYPRTYLRSYSKIELSESHLAFWTNSDRTGEGRFALDDMTLSITTHDGTSFSGVCVRSAGS